MENKTTSDFFINSTGWIVGMDGMCEDAAEWILHIQAQNEVMRNTIETINRENMALHRLLVEYNRRNQEQNKRIAHLSAEALSPIAVRSNPIPSFFS